MLVYKTGGKLEIYSQDELKQMDEISKQISKRKITSNNLRIIRT